jgi:hypothetical protein
VAQVFVKGELDGALDHAPYRFQVAPAGGDAFRTLPVPSQVHVGERNGVTLAPEDY